MIKQIWTRKQPKSFVLAYRFSSNPSLHTFIYTCAIRVLLWGWRRQFFKPSFFKQVSHKSGQIFGQLIRRVRKEVKKRNKNYKQQKEECKEEEEEEEENKKKKKIKRETKGKIGVKGRQAERK